MNFQDVIWILSAQSAGILPAIFTSDSQCPTYHIVGFPKDFIYLAAKDCDACKGDKKCAETKKNEFMECVIDANIKTVAATLTHKSMILKHLLEAKKIRIVAAKYDLDDGIVTLFK